jgi:hypothetical protein
VLRERGQAVRPYYGKAVKRQCRKEKGASKVKTTRVTVLLLVCVTMVLVSASAADEIQLYINGKQVVVTDPSLFMHNEQVYGPVRVIGDAMGAEVHWGFGHVQLSVCLRDKCVHFGLQECQTRRGKSCVSLRKLAEDLGGSITWTQDPTPRVDLTMPAP